MSSLKDWALNLAVTVVTLLALFVGGLRANQWWNQRVQDRPQKVADWAQFASGGHEIGSAEAPVTIVEYADYECPFCRSAAPEIRTILQKYAGKVRFVYRHYPLDFHPQAVPAARAVICAAEQGSFERYHNLLYDPSVNLAQRPWRQIAAAAQVPDTALFASCIEESGPIDRIRRDTVSANRLGFNGTPLFLVNEMRLNGYPEAGYIEKYVKRALDRIERDGDE